MRELLGDWSKSPQRECSVAAVPNLFWHQGLVLWEMIFPQTGVGGGAGFRMIQGHYIYCVLYYYYYIVIYDKIMTYLTILQNQWEPWTWFFCN